uniref:Uncharacterized protein n=1 Tax=Romanomermis culicivorax TaxID=13658 RepID=A0A915JA84_ROMCU
MTLFGCQSNDVTVDLNGYYYNPLEKYQHEVPPFMETSTTIKALLSRKNNKNTVSTFLKSTELPILLRDEF